MDIGYFKAIQSALGANSLAEARIREAKDRIRRELELSCNYIYDSKRNNKVQPMVITSSDAMYKCDIEALPDDELYPGDEIEAIGEHWIVYQTKRTNPFQTLGIGWLCNYEFKFQNGTPDVIKRWGVLDSGVYSTTKTGDETVNTSDKQFKIYLACDPETEKIFVDKRLAVGTKYDQYGKEILDIFKITGRNVIAKSYGKGGHLLVLECRSDEYSPSDDNLTELIADYIPPDEHYGENTPSSACQISGRDNIYVGTSRKYTVKSFDATGVEIPDVEYIWSIDPNDNISYKAKDNTITITAKDVDSLVGTYITISVLSTNYPDLNASKEIEVISVG